MGFTRRNDFLTIRYDIEGMPPLDRLSYYSKTVANFLPEGLEIRLDRERADQWKLSGAEISGGKIRKDGTAGQVVVSRSFYSLEGSGSQGESSMPAWARELIEFHLAELNAGRSG